MTKLILSGLLLLVTVIGSAQPGPAFPGILTGRWKGTVTWMRAGKAPQEFTMRLNVQPADSGRYTWQLIYGDDQADNRPYLLIPVDTAKGHWAVDERNSIVLDSWWIGDTFTGVFSVQGSTILDQYRVVQEGLYVEFVSYATNPVRTSGAGTAESPAVESYAVRSIQRGVLKRVTGKT
jgi:hypothetical protein